MFSTGQNLYLYISVIMYGIALIIYFMSKHKTSLVMLAIGLIIHGLYLAGRGWLGGVFIPNAIFEGPYLLPWCISLIALITGIINHKSGYGFYLLAALAFSAFMLYYPRGMIPPTPKKVTIWASIFFFSEVLAHALFYCGAIAAIKSLLNDKTNFSFHKFIILGFIVYSIAQVTGAVWCYKGWGNTFRWGPRHMNSASIWLFYAAYLHIKYIPRLNNSRFKAAYGCLGAIIVLMGSFSSYINEMFFKRIG